MSRSDRTPNPMNWDNYDGISRTSGSSPEGRSVRFDDDDDPPLSPGSDREVLTMPGTRTGQDMRRRRSSITMRLNALAQVGGVNSIENFARSWQRAASFYEVTPRRPSFILTTDTENEVPGFSRADIENVGEIRTSLLREHLEASPVAADEIFVEDEDDIDPVTTGKIMDQGDSRKTLLASGINNGQGSMRGRATIFAMAPHLASPLSGSYGTSYGTIRSTVNESSMVHAGQLWRQQQLTGATQPDGEREPLVVKEVEQDGKVILVVEGQSTLPQTIFNSTNVLIGIGILSLPLGIKYAGWICGMAFLAFAAGITAYTARILAKCMDVDSSLITFADLAYVSYGSRARFATSILFTVELLGACVALIILFADTLNLLFPGFGALEWKILCGFLMIPLNFAPLRILSFTSIIGIMSTFSIVLIVFFDGFIKPEAPGSLRDPAETFFFPANWLTLPLSFGLLMSPFGGHSIFPSIYKDMRHPEKYGKAVETSFTFTYILDSATAVAGLLMFGEDIMDELTSNMIGLKGYPQSLSIILTGLIALIPITKLPLNARPIITTVEALCGLDVRAVAGSEALVGLSGWSRGILKITIRILVVVVIVFISILVPSFDSIMAFMGSALCFTVCVVLPLLFHLRIFGKEISLSERILNWILVVVGSILAVVGTIFACLPKSMIGAD